MAEQSQWNPRKKPAPRSTYGCRRPISRKPKRALRSALNAVGPFSWWDHLAQRLKGAPNCFARTIFV